MPLAAMLAPISAARLWESAFTAQETFRAEGEHPAEPKVTGRPTLPQDEAEISPEARAFQPRPNGQPPKTDSADPAQKQETSELTEEEQGEVEQLKQRDREVRAHEQAHIAASGGLARGGASFDYQTGPDGKRYAIGGEVQIDTTAVSGDPAATLRKAEQIRRAALAPADPSGQDRQVAAEATRMAAEARQQLAEEKQSGGKGEASNYNSVGRALKADLSAFGLGTVDVRA